MNRPLSRLPRRGGNTLAELMVAVVGASALMVGLSSTIFVAVKATDTANTPTAAMLEGNTALNQLLSELEFAISVDERTATAITWKVPDRDGDAAPETIRYAWTGSPGAPLTRQYNGGPVTAVVDNVYDFQNDLPMPASNLLSNADMESGTTSWQSMVGANISPSSTNQYAGSLSLLVQKGSQNVSGAEQSVVGNIVNGVAYDLDVWTKKAAPGNTGVKLSLVVESTGEGVQLFAGAQISINGSSWTRVTANVTPSWTGSLISAYWRIQATQGADPFYMDDAGLEVDVNLRQHVNISLQVGSNSRSSIQSAVRLLNEPL